MLCPSCGHENREGRLYCAECGSSLGPTCGPCGTQNEAGEKFCDKCGASLAEAAPPARTPTPTATPSAPTSFAAYNQEHAEQPMAVRVGLNTGESIQEAGHYFGIAVTLAARIAARAWGGQILVSDVVRTVGGSLAGVEFRDASRKQLKGIKGRQWVYAVVWE